MSKTTKYLGCAYGTPAKGDRVSINIDSVDSQRDLNETKCWEYINKHGGIDWNLFGYVKVARFPNGVEKLIDGQHKTWCVKQILPDVTEVPADIIDCSPMDAAKYFDELNGGSNNKISPEDRFWSQVCRGNDFAVVLKNTLEKTKFSIGKANRKENCRPMKYSAFRKSLACGETQFLRACEIIDEVFPKDRGYDLLIEALSKLFAVKEYQDLMDGSRGIGKNFVTWLKSLRNDHAQTPGKFKFKKYYNAGPFSVAVAYGLAKYFFATERSKGRKTPSVKIIEQVWQKHAKSAELESLVFFE